MTRARETGGRSSRGIAALELVSWIAVIALGMVFADPSAEGASPASREASAQGTGEYDLKAQFLLRFATPYVKWPESAFEEKTSPFVIAVLGKDPFGKALDDLMKDKRVGDHPIELKRFASVDALERCHMLFVPESQEKQLKRIGEFCKDKPILIVAESIAAAENGAHVGFYLEKSRVRFAINPTAAKAVKLEISSELLKLAKVIDPKPERGK